MYIGSIIISVDKQHELYSQQSTLAHIREAFNEFGNGLVNNMDPTLGSNVMKIVFTTAVKACNERHERAARGIPPAQVGFNPQPTQLRTRVGGDVRMSLWCVSFCINLSAVLEL